MNQSQLERLASKWQPRLRLADWLVTATLTRYFDMDGDDSVGEADTRVERKIATIRILDPVDFDADMPLHDTDVEHTLVHELLHLHFAPFQAKEGTAEQIAQEQAIDALAWSLVTLDREKR
jgi:hypothetical protein